MACRAMRSQRHLRAHMVPLSQLADSHVFRQQPCSLSRAGYTRDPPRTQLTVVSRRQRRVGRWRGVGCRFRLLCAVLARAGVGGWGDGREGGGQGLAGRPFRAQCAVHVALSQLVDYVVSLGAGKSFSRSTRCAYYFSCKLYGKLPKIYPPPEHGLSIYFHPVVSASASAVC